MHRKEFHNKFKCSQCAETFTHCHFLETHLVCKHTDGLPRFLCLVCGKLFMMKSQVNKHKRIHENKTHVACEICGKRFCYNTFLTTHMARVHPDGAATPFRKPAKLPATDPIDSAKSPVKNKLCKICGRGFQWYHQVYAHMRMHEERKLKCSMCNKGFRNEHTLRMHLLNHQQKKQLIQGKFSCDICNRRFTSMESRDTHRRRHLHVEKYHCAVCGQKFKRHYDFQEHQVCGSENIAISIKAHSHQTSALA